MGEEDIDDDDRELLKENLGIDFVKKRKRIRMESGSEDSASEGEGVGDEIPDIEEKEDGGSANEFEEDDLLTLKENLCDLSEKRKRPISSKMKNVKWQKIFSVLSLITESSNNMEMRKKWRKIMRKTWRTLMMIKGNNELKRKRRFHC